MVKTVTTSGSYIHLGRLHDQPGLVRSDRHARDNVAKAMRKTLSLSGMRDITRELPQTVVVWQVSSRGSRDRVSQAVPRALSSPSAQGGR